jgi:antitoxin component of MazEF toxin-antitoxin module
VESVFKTKVRRIGSSLGVLIPKKLIDERSVKEGEEIEIAVIRRKKKLISSSFGMAKGASHFRRDKRDRTY